MRRHLISPIRASHRRRMHRSALASSAFLLGLASFALVNPLSAQDDGQEEAATNRHRRAGFWISFGWGYGSAKQGIDGCGEFCPDGQGVVATYIRMGGTISPKVLLGGEINGVSATDDTGSEATISGIGALVVYFYPAEREGFFLKGGFGMAVRGESGSTDSESGLGLTAGVGYDLRVARNFSLSPFGNLTYGGFDGFSATVWQVGLGFSFH